jgi:hypothetical protein
VSADKNAEKSSDPTKKEVFVGIVVIDILKIDDANQSISLDFAVRFRWNDSSLKGKVETAQPIALSEMWSSNVQLIKEKNLVRKRKEIGILQPDGTVSVYFSTILHYCFVGHVFFIVQPLRFGPIIHTHNNPDTPGCVISLMSYIFGYTIFTECQYIAKFSRTMNY